MIARVLVLLCFAITSLHALSDWTVLIYMAADNDLGPFAYRNIAQMKRVGSNDKLTILVQIDTKTEAGKKITRRYKILFNELEQVGPELYVDCGEEQTLIDALLWANSYNSKHLGLIFWNHGSGDLNPIIGNAINTSQLFQYDPEKNALILDRSRGFLDFVASQLDDTGNARGICFNETTHTYLDDQKLKSALEVIHRHRGKPLDIILFDACFMAGIGTAWLLHEHVRYMVASQEVELGTGYDYTEVLKPLAYSTLKPHDWARHTVNHYESIYKKITPDYTHSAVDLTKITSIANNVDAVAKLLKEAILQQKNNSVITMLRHARNKLLCTSFEEPSYIDLCHLYKNIERYLPMILITNAEATKQYKAILQHYLTEGINLINSCIIERVSGENLPYAHGLSIYFPEREIHSSYEKTLFAQSNNAWVDLLKIYCSSTQEHEKL